jgi:hypothetical protein
VEPPVSQQPPSLSSEQALRLVLLPSAELWLARLPASRQPMLKPWALALRLLSQASALMAVAAPSSRRPEWQASAQAQQASAERRARALQPAWLPRPSPLAPVL